MCKRRDERNYQNGGGRLFVFNGNGHITEKMNERPETRVPKVPYDTSNPRNETGDGTLTGQKKNSDSGSRFMSSLLF